MSDREFKINDYEVEASFPSSYDDPKVKIEKGCLYDKDNITSIELIGKEDIHNLITICEYLKRLYKL